MAVFDTHKAVKTLTAAGFSEEKAEALITAMGEVRTDLTTKADLKDLKLRMMRMHVASVAATVGLVVALLKLLP